MTTGTGPLLRSGNIKEYTPLGEEGNPVHKWASQIRVAIKRKTSSDSINVFAIPQPNENGDILDWYAPESGSVIPWSSATRKEKISAKEQLADIQTKLSVIDEDFKKNGEGDQSVFKQLLEHVMQFPDDEHVYLVNGKPVLTFWGFVDTDANPRPDPLAVLAIPELSNEIENIPVHSNVVESLPVKRRFSWWWLLPLLLLLLLLLFFLRGCDKLAEIPVLEEFVEPKQVDTIPIKQDQNRLNELSHTVERNIINDGTLIDSDNTTNLVDNKQLPTETENIAETNQLPTPEDVNIDKKSEQNNPEPEEDIANKEQDELTKNKQEPIAEKNQDQQQKLPESKSNNEPPQQQPLAIPDQSNPQQSMDFLNGQWRANSGLMDKQGRPVNLEYDFKDGKGSVKIKKNDGTICSGAVDAKMKGSELTFSDKDVIKCPNGKSYQPAQVKCRINDNKQTVCEGAYNSGEKFKMDINKSAAAKE